MEIERPHRTANNSSSSDLFVCFTSRFCSFSHREQPKLSSSSSLTRRRLRTSGSMKGGGGGGGQSSPMLILTGSKKIRGGGSYNNGFENHPEPSSPKVTCIGQVRVKTRKKQGGRCSTRRNRRRNQKWVQLPLTICEGLRAFGADLNCFLPCGGGRSLCSSSSLSERDGTGKRRGGSSSNGSCGAVFARWVMALQEEDKEEEEERRKMDVRVRDEEEVVKREVEIEKEMEVVMLKEDDDEKEEGERISVCIPPRNALLLMRCRSDPVRIAALSANNHCFWDDPFVSNNQDDDVEEEDNSEEEEEDEEKTQVSDEQVEGKLEQKEEEDEMVFKWVVLDEAQNEENSENEDYPIKQQEEEENEPESHENTEQKQEEKADLEEEKGDDDDEIMVNWPLFESFYQLQSLESEEQQEEEQEMPEFEESSSASSEMQLQPPSEEEEDSELMILAEESQKNLENQIENRASEENQTIHTQITSTAHDHHTEQEQSTTKSKEEDEQEEEEGQKSSVLPDCLLSMLYESKLSMEISKETWVCSKDFIGRNSNNQVNTANGSNNIISNKNHQVNAVDGQDKAPTVITHHEQPHRTSFSNPTAAKAAVPSMAALVMQKLMSAVAHEPFVLTRCKSEPPRPSARLVPEACYWKNQNLLLLRPSRRVGGAGGGAAAIGLLAQPKC